MIDKDRIDMVRIRKLVVAIATATALASEVAHALGLGEVTLQSALNQPLIAEIELLDTQGVAINDLRPVLASVDAFNKAGIDRNFFLTDLRFTPVSRGGRNVIQVTSAQAVREPYLNFLLEVRWPSGRLMREYTLLLDPPLYSPETVVAAMPMQAPATVRSTPVAPAPVVRALGQQPVQHAAPVVPILKAPSETLALVGEEQALTEYRTTANDTLWVIASRYRQGGSVQQAMLAIQDLNPDAFLGGNINRMKSGQVLRLPTMEQIRRRSQGDAMLDVASQGAEWRGVVDKATKRQLDATAQPEKTVLPVNIDTTDSLRLLAGAGEAVDANESGRSGRTSGERLAVLQENLDSSRRESQELNDRLQDLQRQVDKLERLMSLKDSQLARLQANVGDDAAPQAEETSLLATEDERIADESSAGNPVIPVATEMVDVFSQEKGLVQVVDSKSENVEVDTSVAVETVSDESEFQDFLNSSLLLPIAVSTSVLLLGVLVIARRRAAKKAEDAYMLDDSLDRPIDLGVSSYAAASDTAGAQGWKKAEAASALPNVAGALSVVVPQAVSVPAVDPIKESDIYIAYGRFEQAVELLQSAINDDPVQGGLKLKLLEVYGEQGDKAAFQRQLQELRDAGVDIELVESIEQRYPALVASVSAVFDGIDYLPEPIASTQADVEFVSHLQPLSSDLVADISGAGLPSETFSESGLAEVVLLDSERNALDVSVDRQNSEDGCINVDEINFKLDSLALNEASQVVESEVGLGATTDDVFFDLDDLEVQLGEIDLELDALGQALDNTVPVTPLNTSNLGLSGLDDELDLMVDADENVTRLDLAGAYIEMGDAEGARDILEEVLGSGSASQKQEAQELLTQLS